MAGILHHELWEIELNFRDEKTVLGVEKAQIRKRRAPQSLSLCYYNLA
jgi:hypothetical protein